MKNKNIISSFARFNCKVQYRQIQDLGSILFNQPTFLENPNLFRQLESKKNKQKMSFNTNIVCNAKIISNALEGTANHFSKYFNQPQFIPQGHFGQFGVIKKKLKNSSFLYFFFKKHETQNAKKF